MLSHIVRGAFGALGLEVTRRRNGQSEVSRRFHRGTKVEHLYEFMFRFGVPADFFFVTVGANDGVTNDPLYPYITSNKLSGVMCEPHPKAFAKLEQAFQGFPAVSLRQVAVSRTVDGLVLYCLSSEYVEQYRATGNNPLGISSTTREHVISQIRQKLGLSQAEASSAVDQVVVPGKSLREIVEQEGTKRFDLLQIDIEGMDHHVLAMIEDLRLKPRVVVFENKHCPSNELSKVLSNMQTWGYRFIHLGSDTMCVMSGDRG